MGQVSQGTSTGFWAALDTPRRRLFAPTQSRLRCTVEIVAVLGGFLVLPSLILLPLDSWLGPALEEFPLAVEVLLRGGCTLLLVGLVARLGRAPDQELGLTRSGVGLDLGLGFLATLPVYAVTAVVSIVLTLIAAQWGGFTLESTAEQKMPLLEAISSISAWTIIPLTLFIGLYEEVLFRGFLMGRLLAITRSTTLAVLLSSLLFGLPHYLAQGWIGVFQASFLGVLLALLTVWRRSLWPAIACHAGIDAVGMTLVLLLNWFLKLMGHDGITEIIG